MPISTRVTEAFTKLKAGDPTEALFAICAAVERTARGEGLPKGKSGFKQFVATSMPVIAAIGVGPALAGVRFSYSHPDLKPSADGTCGLEDVVYHLVRCGLYHDAEISPQLVFTANQIGPGTGGTLMIPAGVVAGLIIAVVAAPSNTSGRTQPGFFVGVGERRYVLNDWWGRRDELIADLARNWPANRRPASA
jgi:hypothetical protein